MATKKNNKIDNDAWITAHFEEIVDKYGGQHIVVSGGEVFIGEDAIDKARKKYPHIIPTSMPVPKASFFKRPFLLSPFGWRFSLRH